MTLEQELIEIFGSTPYQRNREILISYYGWDDGRQRTLTETGARFGITRERVRQVCAKLTKRTKSEIPSKLVMDRALDLIESRLPCPASQIEAELVERGLTEVKLSVETVAVGAELLGRPVRFKTINVQGRRRSAAKRAPPQGRLVIYPEQVESALAIVDLANKEVFFHGLSTAERIHQTVCGRYGEAATPELVRQTLLLREGFRWLDEPAGWFHLAPVHRHGLPKAIDKVLAVAGSLSVGQLRAALSRNHRLAERVPPANVLREFCRQMPNVRIESDRIVSDPPRDWRKTLTGIEAKLVGVLKAHGPIMDRGVMEDLCVGKGMNRFSFHAFLSWSPVIAQYGPSIYGLFGAKVEQEQVDSLLNERRASRAGHRVLNSHGRTDDGNVWLSYRLSKAASTYAVMTVPAALKKVVRGRFQFVDAKGHEVGTLTTKDGRAWGLGTFLRRQGARIGDRITLVLDLKDRTAAVTLDCDGQDGQGKTLQAILDAAR